MMNVEADFQQLAERFSSLSPAQRQAVYKKIRAGGLGMERFPVLRRSESLRSQCPGSYAQRRQWFLWELDRASTAYHISGGLRLKGEVNLDALQGSFA
ncbi:hypothetical protein GRF61_23290, partial [Azoarcus sp. TTM-91]|uniref:hypothetical protein n=1 Tax=Azoarcus sp. TTM-91 TaxID=2691581 RepID=UPI00145E14A5